MLLGVAVGELMRVMIWTPVVPMVGLRVGAFDGEPVGESVSEFLGVSVEARALQDPAGVAVGVINNVIFVISIHTCQIQALFVILQIVI